MNALCAAVFCFVDSDPLYICTCIVYSDVLRKHCCCDVLCIPRKKGNTFAVPGSGSVSGDVELEQLSLPLPSSFSKLIVCQAIACPPSPLERPGLPALRVAFAANRPSLPSPLRETPAIRPSFPSPFRLQRTDAFALKDSIMVM